MLYEGNKAYYPLIPIGQNVKIGPTEADVVGCLCVSPSGRIAIVERDPITKDEIERDFLNRMTRCSDIIRTWNWTKLNEIAETHYYHAEGQAFRVIDLMARAGYLQFADEGLLSIKLDRGLKTEQHLVIVASPNVRERRSAYTCGAFAESHLYFSLAGEDLPFLPK